MYPGFVIEREITPHLLRLFGQYPIVTVTGPRQAGKTTLCRKAFADLAYANLEDSDAREFAESDPRRFLAQFPVGAVLDEIQRVPSLLSYLQVLVDEDRRNGQFVLTGSEQSGLTSTISQSLAGRTALLRLLPFTLAERRLAGASDSVDEILYSGCYPRIYDQGLNPTQTLADYLVTYVERDAQRIGGIRDLAAFHRFIRLCAGRVGQLVNLSSLGADVGVSQLTARQQRRSHAQTRADPPCRHLVARAGHRAGGFANEAAGRSAASVSVSGNYQGASRSISSWMSSTAPSAASWPITENRGTSMPAAMRSRYSARSGNSSGRSSNDTAKCSTMRSNSSDWKSMAEGCPAGPRSLGSALSRSRKKSEATRTTLRLPIKRSWKS